MKCARKWKKTIATTQSITLAQDKAKKLAELAKTQDFDKAAKSLGLTPKESNDFSANEYVEGVGSGTQLSDAFTLNPGQVSGVISVGTNQVLFKVVSHTPANEADFAAQRDQIREELLDQKRDLQFEIYRAEPEGPVHSIRQIEDQRCRHEEVPGLLPGAVAQQTLFTVEARKQVSGASKTLTPDTFSASKEGVRFQAPSAS